MAKGPRLGPNVVRPQKQPLVESEPSATTEANIAEVNCFGRDIESTFIQPVIRSEAEPFVASTFVTCFAQVISGPACRRVDGTVIE